MIERIIADGRPGAAVAALDVAIKLGLTHGGWCREKDRVPDRYQLDRIPLESRRTVVERAIGATDGSLYFTRGNSSSFELERHRKTTLRLNKPFLLLDLDRDSGFSASRRIAGWIGENRIRVLHVDGQAEEQDAVWMADSVAGILEAAFFLAMAEIGITSPLSSIVRQERLSQPQPPPETMSVALDRLERSLSLKDKATIANMAVEELVSLHFTLGNYINTHFDLFTTNTALLADCQAYSGRINLSPKDAAAVIIRCLWKRLRETCRIRVIK